MKFSQQDIQNILIKKYGLLISIAQLAELLNRSKNGLRISLQQNSDVAEKFNPARIKIGRRVYFDAGTLASILSREIDSDHTR